ncbi:unnamed protein product [Moneuplotes crassus]|uniref:Uncharacterized protein n=1 Tax=Euplotes crassus TaxID=5936 RepID=A0AAD1X5B6_EUPCR|nr:unnamed protein product [Moneuplotes crassus]
MYPRSCSEILDIRTKHLPGRIEVENKSKKSKVRRMEKLQKHLRARQTGNEYRMSQNVSPKYNILPPVEMRSTRVLSKQKVKGFSHNLKIKMKLKKSKEKKPTESFDNKPQNLEELQIEDKGVNESSNLYDLRPKSQARINGKKNKASFDEYMINPHSTSKGIQHRFSSIGLLNMSKPDQSSFIRTKICNSSTRQSRLENFVKNIDKKPGLSEHVSFSKNKNMKKGLFVISKQLSENVSIYDTPKAPDRKFNMKNLFSKIIPRVNSSARKQGKAGFMNFTSNDASLNNLNTQFIGDEGLEPSLENGVLGEMMEDIKKSEDFRFIQKHAYRSNERTCDNALLTREMNLFDSKSTNTGQEKSYFQFQTAYIENCRKFRILPLPLLKKIKYSVLVLDNYQLSSQISKAFSNSMYFLSSYITGVKLINNNMKDADIACFLKGMMYNPIKDLTIENNILREQSGEALCNIINALENDKVLDIYSKTMEFGQDEKYLDVKINITKLELIDCDIKGILLKKIMREIRVNREIEELRLSSIDFSTDIISNLSEFVANNFALKSLNLSWSEISSDDLLLFLSRIEQIKHLQHFDISTIPFQGPSLDKLVDLLKQFIINNPSLIHLNISSCNLSSNEIKILLEGIRKSKSLLSVHLSGNTNQEDIAKLLGTNCRKPSLSQLISGRPGESLNMNRSV